VRRCAGLVRGLEQAHEARGELLGLFGGVAAGTRDFRGGGALLLDRGSDARADLVDARDGLVDVVDRRDRLIGRALHRMDAAGNFFRCLRGLGGELFDLRGNDGEPFAGFARARLRWSR
jgi:hypothetical protein